MRNKLPVFLAALFIESLFALFAASPLLASNQTVLQYLFGANACLYQAWYDVPLHFTVTRNDMLCGLIDLAIRFVVDNFDCSKVSLRSDPIPQLPKFEHGGVLLDTVVESEVEPFRLIPEERVGISAEVIEDMLKDFCVEKEVNRARRTDNVSNIVLMEFTAGYNANGNVCCSTTKYSML